MTGSGRIELADARAFLRAQEPGCAAAIVIDPPYSRGTPMRGREDGAAGSVARPWKMLREVLELCVPLLIMPREPYTKPAHKGDPVGIVVMFTDWDLLGDLEDMACSAGLREQARLAWCRTRSGGGAMFRSAADPVLIASRISPRPVDHRYHAPNWFIADHELPRAHPYSKPVPLLEYILGRVVRRGDTILDPFAGSGSSRVAAENLKLDLVWKGADIDPRYAEADP
jgi:hypothetical protein